MSTLGLLVLKIKFKINYKYTTISYSLIFHPPPHSIASTILDLRDPLRTGRPQKYVIHTQLYVTFLFLKNGKCEL